MDMASFSDLCPLRVCTMYIHLFCKKKQCPLRRTAWMPGGGLSGQRSDCREFCEQSIEAFTTKSTLDSSLRFLPQRPCTPESLFPFLGQKHPAHASIFAFLTANKVLFDKQLQVAGEGRPVYVHVLSQAMDRD